MSGYTFFLGMVAGIALLAVSVFALDGPEGIVSWLSAQTEPRPRSTATSIPIGQMRPQSGYLPGDPTPTPMALPSIPAPGETPVPTPAVATPAHTAPGADGREMTAPHCPTGPAPVFQAGFARLRQQVGDAMGQPLECEHTNPANGDRLQHTTSGLAVYTPAMGLTRFTNGWQHWALTSAGLVAWQGTSETPPPEVAGARATPTVSGGERMGVVNTDGVGVVFRNSPNPDDRQTRGLLPGQVATVLERSGSDWLRVRAPNGVEGWVPAEYLRPVD